MKDFVFVSGNINKVRWLEKFLGQKVEHKKLDLKEVQSLDPVEVVKEKAEEAHSILKKPVLIEDTSVVCNALGQLPGPFIKFFLSEVGNDGICKILNSYDDRSATASVVYGMYDGKNFQFHGAEVNGKISNEPKGDGGHGWDPIFIPEGQPKTYGQMNETEYAKYAVRNKAVQKLLGVL